MQNDFWISRDSEIAESKKEIGTLKQEIDRLDSERENLLSKIEAGDGVNTALEQLKQQSAIFHLLLDKSFESRNQSYKTLLLRVFWISKFQYL